MASRDAIKGSSVKFLAEKFGDTGVQTQLQLIQDDTFGASATLSRMTKKNSNIRLG
jgi:hypothetical protein